jgi:ribosomal subunit interface protein
MKIVYSGKTSVLGEADQQKLERRLQKLARFVDMKKGERVAHVSLRLEKRIYRADVSILYKGEVLATTSEGPDAYTATSSAVEKLERQLLRSREKRQDTRKRAAARDDKRGKSVVNPEVLAPSFSAIEEDGEGDGSEAAGSKVTIHRVNHLAKRKPLTVDEAVLAMRKNQPYIVFRDAQREAISILIRRGAEEFDLIETAQ